MSKEIQLLVVFVTCGNEEEAQTISNALVRRRLAACGNIIPGVTSVFQWKNKVTHDQEVLVVFKTRKSLFSDLVSAVKELHTYKVPEIIGLPIVSGSKEYLHWLVEETRSEDDTTDDGGS